MSNLALENSKGSDSGYREQNRGVTVESARAPEPGSEVAGPTMFQMVQETRRSIEVQSELLKAAIPLLDRRIVVDYATGQTDSSGLLDLKIYTVPMGMQFLINRVNIEDGTHTVATPYTNATGWIALIRGDKWQPGSIVDFLPNPAAASGAILPSQFSDGASEAAVFRGGEIIGLHLASGPVSTDIWVRIQGMMEPI